MPKPSLTYRQPFTLQVEEQTPWVIEMMNFAVAGVQLGSEGWFAKVHPAVAANIFIPDDWCRSFERRSTSGTQHQGDGSEANLLPTPLHHDSLLGGW
jgi:hypothetical protein